MEMPMGSWASLDLGSGQTRLRPPRVNRCDEQRVEGRGIIWFISTGLPCSVLCHDSSVI